MHRAQQTILSSRPFAVRLKKTLEGWSASSLEEQILTHPLVRENQSSKVGLLVVSSDKGLCGAFNVNLFRQCVGWMRRRESDRIFLFLIGKKGRDFFRKLALPNVQIVEEVTGIFPRVHYSHAELLGNVLLNAYQEQSFRSVTCLYNEFRSVMRQGVETLELLPLRHPTRSEAVSARQVEYLYEPGSREILDVLLPRYLKAQIYRVLMESQAAELAARMNAMDSATRNADELLGGLTLSFNRTRQDSITKEIAELVGGADALAGAAC